MAALDVLALGDDAELRGRMITGLRAFLQVDPQAIYNVKEP